MLATRMLTLRRLSVTPENMVRQGESPPLDVKRIKPPSPTAKQSATSGIATHSGEEVEHRAARQQCGGGDGSLCQGLPKARQQGGASEGLDPQGSQSGSVSTSCREGNVPAKPLLFTQ